MKSPIINILLRIIASFILAYVLLFFIEVSSYLEPTIVYVMLTILFSIVFVYLYLNNRWLPDVENEVSYLRRQADHLNHTALVSETDKHGVINYVNDNFCKVSQYSREELIGKTHQVVNSGYHSKEFWQQYWQVISSGKIWRGEIKNKAKDGSYYWIFSTVSAIKDKDDEIIGYKAVRININDLKEAEFREIERRERVAHFNETIAKLSRHESFITQDYSELLLKITKTVSQTLDVARVSIWTFDHDDEGSFIHLSNLWDKKESRYNKNLILHSKDFPAYFNVLAEDRLLNYDDVYKEPNLIDFHESYFPENNIVSMMDSPFYQSGQIAGVICLEHTGELRHWRLDEQAFLLSVSDILTIIYESAKRLETEQSLRHSEKLEALGNLTSGIAHDFNNLLGIVMGYSEILVKKLEDEPALMKYANQIHAASLRGAKLTTNLLSFSRKKNIKKELFSISDFVTQHTDMIQKTLTVAIQVTNDCEPSDWQVHLDLSDLEHALLNLCINSMHAMDEVESPEVRLSTSNRSVSDLLGNKLGITPGEYSVLSISDNGCGIEPHLLSKVLDPFYTTKGDKGTGLGLAQVNAFMKRSKGAMDIESTMGMGTIVSLYFPRIIGGSITATEINQETDTPVKKGNNEIILIVDDETDVCMMTSEILSGHGYKTHTVQSAIDALTYLQKNQVDLILTDIVMPQMDGYLFTAKVNKLYPDIKIQLMSGYSENNDDSMIDQHLLEELLPKPFEPEALLRQITRTLNKH